VTRSQSEASHPLAGVARSILTILSNKYKIETLEHLMKIIDTRADTLTEQLQSEPGHAAAAHHLDALAAIAAGMLRRNAGKQAQSLLRVLKASLQSTTSPPSAGAARRLEALVVPQDILSKENFAVVRPLWTQKTYFDVVKPLLATALKPNENSTQDVRANVSAAVLLMVRHMDFTVYENDAEDILRVAISVAQRGISTATSGGSSADVRASLHVLKDILVADKDKGRLHLKSIVSICVDIFSRTASGVRPDPHCVKLSLEITGGLPNMFEAQHLLMYRPRVERELALACGNPVREARRTARLAREAWERLK
jgi:DNA repair/transcription protein MET18/MMS19